MCEGLYVPDRESSSLPHKNQILYNIRLHQIHHISIQTYSRLHLLYSGP